MTGFSAPQGKPKVARAKGPPAYGSPGRTLRRPEPLRRALFGDRRFESFFLQRRVHREPDFQEPTTFKLKATLVAQIGAAIGREFSYALPRTVSRLAQAELQAALARLVASELVFQRGTPPEIGRAHVCT